MRLALEFTLVSIMIIGVFVVTYRLDRRAERRALDKRALDKRLRSAIGTAEENFKARMIAAAVIDSWQYRNSQVPEATHPWDEIPYDLRKVIMPETNPKEWN